MYMETEYISKSCSVRSNFDKPWYLEIFLQFRMKSMDLYFYLDCSLIGYMKVHSYIQLKNGSIICTVAFNSDICSMYVCTLTCIIIYFCSLCMPTSQYVFFHITVGKRLMSTTVHILHSHESCHPVYLYD